MLDLPACLTLCCVAVLPPLLKGKFYRWQGLLMLVIYAAYKMCIRDRLFSYNDFSAQKGAPPMELHARLVRSQLNFFKPFVANCSLEVTRKGQDKLGELMTAMHRREVYVREHDFGAFQGCLLYTSRTSR